MKTRVEEKDFQKPKRRAGRGIAVKAALIVAVDLVEKFHSAAAPLLCFGMEKALFHIIHNASTFEEF